MKRTTQAVPLLVMMSICVISTIAQANEARVMAAARTETVDVSSYIESTDFGKYVGCAVSKLVADLKVPYQKVYPIEEPPFKLVGFALQLSDGYVMNLYTEELRYTQRYSERRDWQFETFLKEKISSITVQRFGKNRYFKEFPASSGMCGSSG